ncbi:uncharacterized protein MYCFIDRAFT_197104 [Pseudocercospora fijiensis CIRAD86]|uniref:Protein kinase domain-containing protein n=1 Tax=Pseudocercospora fijiensis (strain CIRAD86) TaxID=383855 RepID=M3AXI4_PSEFD|nr:uncharacterized protein MYCFIDRAFT_197104 [Pseudocercospora fijiensis CIRAD86]EME81803.1 hypothetical protein MYCFIDRAFT_197104 [Pseudocercospora fijiensis CIRAD86]
MSGAEAAAGVAGLVLALPGVIDLCIKYGNFLKEKIESYRKFDEVVKLEHFVTELVSGELNILLGFFHSIHDQMTETIKNGVYQLFQVLRTALENAINQFPKGRPTVGTKLAFSLSGRKRISEAVEELETWHGRLVTRAMVVLFFGGSIAAGQKQITSNPAIARIVRIRGAFKDDQRRATLRLRTPDAKDITSKVDQSEIWDLAQTRTLIEYRKYDPVTTSKQTAELEVNVRDLSARLNHVIASESGLLHCTGFSEDQAGHSFLMHFAYPERKANPRSLQSLLTDPTNISVGIKHSQTDRIVLARRLTSAVLYLHSANFVHKNIRPSNILIFDEVPQDGDQPSTYPNVVGDPYLVGFDDVRKADAKSNMVRVDEWQKNIYLHPDRHRMSAGDEFTMRHDLYSVGVVLLEIALWGSFTDRSSRGIGRQLLESGGALRSPEALKQRYIRLARTLVPRSLGNLYSEVTVACLEGLKDEEQGGLLDDQDGIVVGEAYISQIMTKLDEIRL